MILPIKLFYQLVPLEMFLIQTAQSRYDLFVLLLLLLLLLYFFVYLLLVCFMCILYLYVLINGWIRRCKNITEKFSH